MNSNNNNSLSPFSLIPIMNSSDNRTKQLTFDHQGSMMMMMMSTTNTNSNSPKLEDFLGVGGPTTMAANNDIIETTDQALSLYKYGNLVCYNSNCAGNGVGDLNTLISLSMNDPQASSCLSTTTAITPRQLLLTSANNNGGCDEDDDDDQSLVAMVNNNKNKRSFDQKTPGQKQQIAVQRKSIDTFGQRTSQYRGVTRHRWTGRYEAHLWDNSCKKEGQTRKGRQVYLGGYDIEEKAARAYDLAALKYWGLSTHINFQLENYTHEVEEMKNMTRQEYVAHLRRRSSGFSRGASIYRGVTRHHQHGRWQARIGRVSGNKDLYLGTFSTQEEAAEAYDIAAIKFRGTNAVTNFDMSRYDVDKIIASNTLPAAELARRDNTNEIEPMTTTKQVRAEGNDNMSHDIADWRMVLYNQSNQKSCDPSELNGLVGLEPLGLSQLEPDKPMTKLDQHFSDPSSLVTSLCSSREDSPIDKTHPFIGADNYGNISSWSQPAPPHISIPHYMPFFAAWNES
ncbi:AP2-like ethylene-responsive transcription factor CRL5 [Impatiens glandulifera]|uniref:AP2-like ethylene-responsive transcription factor CRL5 n=1 Tax=Impatiens glandulifera TaxID=253017 RepID=UPI001FB0D26F|nr:AP2-like ethylene-responsive transcription factor CRL5 [Impatiens glandulifera]